MNEQTVYATVHNKTEIEAHRYKESATEAELKDLKKKCNSAGLITLISTVLFTVVSIVVVMIYTIVSFEITLPSSIDSIPDNLINGVVSLFSFGLIGGMFLKINKTTSSEALAFSKVNFLKLTALVFIGFSVCMVSNMLTNFYLINMYNLGINLNLDIETPVSDSALEMAIYYISTAIVPAISEEFVFRGVILSSLRKYGDGLAVLVSALLFGLIHANFVQIPFAFITGLVLGFATVYTNSMLPAIIIHAFNNGFSVVSDILYTNLEDSSFALGLIDTFSYIFLIICMLVAVVSAVILSKKDKNFPKLKPYNGVLDAKTRTKTVFKSPAIIIATLFLLAESIFNHATIALM